MQPVAISGPSMEPTLHVGDVVVVKEVDPTDVEIRDIVRFFDQGRFVVHRIVEIETTRGRLQFVTRGDGNNVDDPPVPAVNVRGKVVLTIPELGWPSIWLRQAVD
jgi:signal peptidase